MRDQDRKGSAKSQVAANASLVYARKCGDVKTNIIEAAIERHASESGMYVYTPAADKLTKKT